MALPDIFPLVYDRSEATSYYVDNGLQNIENGSSFYTENGTLSSSRTVNLNDKSILFTGDIEAGVTSAFGIKQFTFPIAQTFYGSLNVMTDEASGDFGFSGAADLSTFGLSKEAAFIGHIAANGDTSVILSDLVNNVPTIILQCYLASAFATGFQGIINPTSFSFGIGLNGTSLNLDDTQQTITMTAANGVLLKPPTTDPHIVGVLWNDNGTPKISQG